MIRPVLLTYIFVFLYEKCEEIPIIQNFTPFSEDHCNLHTMYSLRATKCVYKNNYFQLKRDHRVHDPMVVIFSSINGFNVFCHER